MKTKKKTEVQKKKRAKKKNVDFVFQKRFSVLFLSQKCPLTLFLTRFFFNPRKKFSFFLFLLEKIQEKVCFCLFSGKSLFGNPKFFDHDEEKGIIDSLGRLHHRSSTGFLLFLLQVGTFSTLRSQSVLDWDLCLILVHHHSNVLRLSIFVWNHLRCCCHEIFQTSDIAGKNSN